jgi:uracil-DNA glycosylase family protein
MARAPSITSLKKAAKNCRACDLYKLGTQTVFGDGPLTAPIMLVGEQPGNEEDQQGLPFVGPAGRILDKALAEAGIDRAKVYVTNAVKHFKWTPGDRPQKPRLHKTPNAAEIKACHPWLEAEVAAIKPKVVVALGRTAEKACRSLGVEMIHTYHPSAILRVYDREQREPMMAKLVKDLKRAKQFV